MNEVKVNLENLTDDERKQLMALVEKGNKVGKVFKPKYGDKYWHIGADGNIGCYVWTDYNFDNECYAMGNCYPTERLCEFAKQKKIVTTELERFAEEHNECEIDWNNSTQSKYFMVYDHAYNRFTFNTQGSIQRPNEVAFTSEAIMRQAINIIGAKRLKKYYFGVEE